MVDWILIDGPDAAAAFTGNLAIAPRAAYGRNAIGAALLEGQRLIGDNNINGFRHVIDFSGDSLGNSSGPPIVQSRDRVLVTGIVINGLPILRP